MASIFDACSEAFNENFAFLKFIVYAIPVYFCITSYMKGDMQSFQIAVLITSILAIALLTRGIHNVRVNNAEILTFNPIDLITALLKFCVAILPMAAIYWFAGNYIINSVSGIIDTPKIKLVFESIIWLLFGCLLCTQYLAFSKGLSIKQAYKFKTIFEAGADLLVGILFFIPQYIIALAVLIVPAGYLFHIFGLPYNHWGCIMYISLVSVIALSILANYMSQLAYDTIKNDASESEKGYIIGVDEDNFEGNKNK